MGMTDTERARRKRFDLPRARVNGVVHDVRTKDRSRVSVYGAFNGFDETNLTRCGLCFRHVTLPESYVVTCMECIGMTEIEFLQFEIQTLHGNYQRACETIAKMHAAAVGEITGPRRGVIEDVEDLRLDRDALKSRLFEALYGKPKP